MQTPHPPTALAQPTGSKHISQTPRTSFGASLPLLILAALTLTLTPACRKPDPTTGLALVPSVAYAPYVSAFTSGTVSARDPIIVELTETVAQSNIGTEAPKDLLSFNPKIAGQLTWTAPAQLTFVPAEPLPQDQPYQATLDLRALFPAVPDSLARMRFGFRVMAQGLALQEVTLAPDLVDARNGRMRLSGTLRSFDRADADDVQAALTARRTARPCP